MVKPKVRVTEHLRLPWLLLLHLQKPLLPQQPASSPQHASPLQLPPPPPEFGLG